MLNRITQTSLIAWTFFIAACGETTGAGDTDSGTNLDSGSETNLDSGSDAGLDGLADVRDSGTLPDGEIPVEERTYPVIDTAQDLCYQNSTEMTCAGDGQFVGQDAQYHGLTPDLVDNVDGTVSDLVTGLMWQQDPGDKMTFDAALAGAETFSLAGYDDWRLPTIQELYSLMDFRGLDPSGIEGDDTSGMVPFIDDTVFDYEYGDPNAGERIIDSQFATSTLYVSTTMGGDETMFGVNFADGRIKGYPIGAMPGQPEGKLFFVLYVRGNEEYGLNDFDDGGDATITDFATGLMWQQADSGEGLNWEDAIDYCEELSLASHADWRLPNAKELQSIVDYTRSPDTTGSAAIDPLFQATPFTNEAGQEDWAHYWTSTTHANSSAGRGGANGAYVVFGRALGYMNGNWIDVHGAGAQRSDPKDGDPGDYPTGHGPQGDAIRIFNMVRCVRLGAYFENIEPGGGADPLCGNDDCEPGEAESCPGDCTGEDQPIQCDDAAPGVPCCGDDRCEGNETESNCPADCNSGPIDGPTACDEQADCEAPGACPEDAVLGCECATMPMGGDACIPRCEHDDDCPSPPGMTLTCSDEGICVPE